MVGGHHAKECLQRIRDVITSIDEKQGSAERKGCLGTICRTHGGSARPRTTEVDNRQNEEKTRYEGGGPNKARRFTAPRGYVGNR